MKHIIKFLKTIPFSNGWKLTYILSFTSGLIFGWFYHDISFMF